VTEFIVLYDSCVLYPAPLRDFLMQLAMTDLYRAKWSHDIHEEWIKNLLKNRSDLKRENLMMVRSLMDQHVRECLVENYEAIIPTLNLPDKNDNHVLAAAIKSSASTIVTFNLKDFPRNVIEEYNIEAQHPDNFIVDLFDLSIGMVCSAARSCRNRLKNPAFNVERYLNNLERQSLPKTVSRLREFHDII